MPSDCDANGWRLGPAVLMAMLKLFVAVLVFVCCQPLLAIVCRQMYMYQRALIHVTLILLTQFQTFYHRHVCQTLFHLIRPQVNNC